MVGSRLEHSDRPIGHTLGFQVKESFDFLCKV